jgi:hypothetical protein
VISHAQYLNLVYSQTRTLYDFIPDAPLPSTNPTPKHLTTSHSTNGVIGTFHADTQSIHASHNNPKSNHSNAQDTPTPTPTATENNQNKKKGKGKNEENNNNPQSDKPKTQTTDEKDKHKPRYPCLIYGDDHYMKYFPRRAEATKFLEGTEKPSTPVVLSQPFPSQKKSQLVIHDQATPSTSSYVLMCIGDSKKNEVAVATRAKDYSLLKENVDDIPPLLLQHSPPTSPPNSPRHLH